MIASVQNLKFKYSGQDSLVLDIPFFEIKPNEKIFLFGSSGCGKTTFLEALAGVITPSQGDVIIAGENLTNLSMPQKDRLRGLQLGYIFQNFNLIPYLSVKENILLPLQLIPEKLKEISLNQRDEDLTMICSKLGILDLLDKNVTALSVGQQQRVAAARSLIGRPKLILADEPTSALDFDHREKFIQLLFELADRHQTALLFVSHDRTLQNLFDRAVQFDQINRREHV